MKPSIVFVTYLIICIVLLTGWIKNIVKLTKCDFEPSYKSEVLRIIGIPVAPMGVVIGYMDLTDIKTTEKK